MWEKICAEGWESNGKTEKVAEIVDTQGFAFSVFLSVFRSVFRSVFPFKGEPVGGLWEAVWFSCVRVCGNSFHTPFLIPVFACLILQAGL